MVEPGEPSIAPVEGHSTKALRITAFFAWTSRQLAQAAEFAVAIDLRVCGAQALALSEIVGGIPDLSIFRGGAHALLASKAR
jgi:hypothetical protein